MSIGRNVLGIAAVAVAAALAGCGGGGSHLLPARANPGSGSGATGASVSGPVQTKVTVRIPARAAASAQRGPKYVPATANGVAFTVWPVGQSMPATPTTVGDLSSSSSLCAPNADGSRTCTVQLLAPVGPDNIVVTVFDQSPSNGAPEGNALSTQSLTFTVVSGANNTLPLVLGGIPFSVVLGPEPGYSVPPSPQTLTMTVNARDIDGNTIVGPGLYASPISLAVTNDPNGTTTLSTYTVTDPTNNQVTISYNGGSLGNGVTITGTASGARSGSLLLERGTSGVVGVISVPGYAAGAFVAWDANNQRLDLYAAGATSGSQPASTLQAPGYPTGLATDAAGNLYATLTTGAINVYSSSGQLQRSFSAINSSACCALSVDAAGDVYSAWYGHIDIYPPGASGAVSPSRSIFGSNTTLTSVRQLGVDANGVVYALDPSNQTVKAFTAGANGNVAPAVALPTGMQYADGLALDGHGLLYVVGATGSGLEVNIYDTTQSGWPMVRQIAGPQTNANIWCPQQIALDANANIYILGSCPTGASGVGGYLTRVVEYAANASGDATPVSTSSLTGAIDEIGLAVSPSGTVYLSNHDYAEIDIVPQGSSTVSGTILTGNGRGPSSVSQIATDTAGNIYMATHTCSGDEHVYIYAPGSTGSAQPTRILGGSLYWLSPCLSGVAVDGSGSIYVSEQFGSGGGDIQVYLAGGYRSYRTITGLNQPMNLAFDPAGNLWVADNGSGTLRAFAPGASGNATPVNVIGGSNTGLTGVQGVAVDGAGFIYASTSVQTMVFAPGSTGNTVPVRTIARGSSSIGIDANDYLYEAPIAVFAPNASGSVPPIVEIQSNFPQQWYDAILPLAGTNASSASRRVR